MADTEKAIFSPEEVMEICRICGDSTATCKGCPGFQEHSCTVDSVTLLALDALKALVEENKRLREERRWVPTSERLPETGDGPIIVMEDCTAVFVLVMIEGAITATTLYFNVDNHDFFDMQVDELIPYRITHWKPMPKAPEVGHD